MTKKHFEQAAAITAEHPDFSRGVVATAFAEFFQADNPRFDKQRFLVACDLAVAPPKPQRSAKRHRAGDPFVIDRLTEGDPGMANTDVEVENHGSIALLRALTPEATAWLEENCGTESWQWLGSALAVEPRYVAPIIEGLRDEGFTVSAGGAACL